MNDARGRVWTEFIRLESDLRNTDEAVRESAYDRFLETLHEYHAGLYFEVGRAPRAPWNMVVTAEGNVAFFGAVETLVAAAPSVSTWRFTALMPARGFGFVTSYGRAKVDPASCRVAVVAPLRSSRWDLTVMCPGFEAELADDFECAVRVSLTNGLGERAFGEHVGSISVTDTLDVGDNAIALSDLSHLVAQRATPA